MATEQKASAFGRKADHTGPPSLELFRIVGALLHLAIPFVTYQIMYNDLVTDYLAKVTTVVPLSPERKALYMFLNVYYAIRWAFGMLTMNVTMSMGVSIGVAVLHLFFHEVPFIVFSMGFWGAPYDLTVRDYVAAALMILAGILQHGAEAQRWWFKRDPANRGKLHTSGLFGLARGINHTGHVLRDLASCLFAPNPFFILYLFGAHMLFFRIFPETIEHMQSKYGEKYEVYAKATPYLFIPGVY